MGKSFATNIWSFAVPLGTLNVEVGDQVTISGSPNEALYPDININGTWTIDAIALDNGFGQDVYTSNALNTEMNDIPFFNASGYGTFTVTGGIIPETTVELLTVNAASATYLTQSNASAIYATIESPTFTGTVTIPTLDLTNALPIADGGTGTTTASAAFNALAPSQASNSGKYLTTNGTTTSWATVEGGGGGGGTASDDTIFKAQLFFGGSN